jgi:hypothetical protein
MNVRTTIDIPQPLHDKLRHKAQQSRSSIRALILTALEQAYTPRKKGRYVTGPMITSRGKRGPRFPVDENPHDLILP